MRRNPGPVRLIAGCGQDDETARPSARDAWRSFHVWFLCFFAGLHMRALIGWAFGRIQTINAGNTVPASSFACTPGQTMPATDPAAAQMHNLSRIRIRVRPP